MTRLTFVTTVLFTCLLSHFTHLHAQDRIPNGGFEYYYSCPIGTGALSLAPPWNSPNQGTPDLLNICPGPVCPTCVPDNDPGYQMPKKGNGYAGFVALSNMDSTSYREYAQVKLSAPLTKNVEYTIKFHLSLADESLFALDEIGVVFSETELSASHDHFIDSVPGIVSTDGDYLDDTHGWMVVSGNYKAKGGEEYLIFGNFKAGNETDTLRMNPNLPSQFRYYSYYYLVCQFSKE